jgi:glycosyl transferase, family 25
MVSIEFRVISLTAAAQRRGMVEQRMARLGLPWRFYDAHTASDNTLPYDAERALTRRGYRLKPAEIGCFSSHVGCLRAYLADPTGAEFLIVLEDDVLLDEHFDFSRLPELLRSLDIHYLKLFSRFITRSRYLGRIGARGLYRFVVPPYGTQAYVVSKSGARSLVNALSRIERPVDDEMDRYWTNGLPTYALFPYPALESDLGTTVAKGFSESTPLTLRQTLSLRAHVWAEKLPREWASLRLRANDRVVSAKLAKFAVR